MMNIKSILAPALLFNLALFDVCTGAGTGSSKDPCTPDGCVPSSTVCVFDVKLVAIGNAIAYYEFNACPGVQQPTLGMIQGVEYRFNQYDPTNIMHPLGYAYYTDGAHQNVDELEPKIAPPGTGSTCAETNACQAPMYYQDETYQGDYVPTGGVGSDFGLNFYEPFFKYPNFAWGGPDAGPKTIPMVNPTNTPVTSPLNWNVRLNLTDTTFLGDIFYFCHIHIGMSGRVKQLSPVDGSILSPNDFPPLEGNLRGAPLYPAPTYKIVSSGQETECGTVGLNSFFEDKHNGKCPTNYICTEGLTFNAEAEVFNDCLDAMNCAMQYSMIIVPNQTNPLVTFVHSMVPHHENAIQMCKSLLVTEYAENDPLKFPDLDFKALCWNIINVQSLQIMEMLTYLDAADIAEGSAKCFDSPAEAISVSSNTGFTNQEPFLISIVTFAAATFAVAVASFAAAGYFTGGAGGVAAAKTVESPA